MGISCFLKYFHIPLQTRNVNAIRTRTAVNLAHKIHGSLSESTPPIIVLHGLFGSKRNWESMCAKLASSTLKAVVAADIRNHGESPHDPSHTYPELASDVSQLMSTLSISKACLLGHSMGGRTSMVLALTEPEKVLKLLIVDISPVSTAGILNNFFPRLLDVMKPINFEGLDLSRARSLARQKIKESGVIEHEGLMHFVIMNVGKRFDGKIGWMCNIDALKRHFETIASFPDMHGKTFDGPVLFIGGDQSNYIPPNDINGIRSLFPKAELKYVKGVGHNVHAENPAVFHSMATEFFNK